MATGVVSAKAGMALAAKVLEAAWNERRMRFIIVCFVVFRDIIVYLGPD